MHFNVRRNMKRLYLDLFYRQLWAKFAFVFLLIITIPVITLGVLLMRSSQTALKNSVLNKHRQIVVRAASEIELFVERPQDLLKASAAMLGRIHVGAWEQQTILTELVISKPEFIRIVSVEYPQTIIASSELVADVDYDYSPEIFKMIQKGESYVSEVKFLDKRTPYITIAVPIKRLGEIARVLIADVNLRGLWNIIDGIKLGQTGRAFLVSGDGIIIAHQDKSRVFKNENYADNLDVKDVLLGLTNSIEFQDEAKLRWVSAYAPIEKAGWGVVLRQRQKEAYLFLNLMKFQSWIMIFIAELIGIIVSIFMAKAFIRPIRTLVARFKNVANGNLEHDIGVRRKDEIGELEHSFNRMTQDLRKAKSREHFSAMGESVTRVAHELKNSLVSIKSFVYLFPRKCGDEKFINKFSRLMPDEINRWERMIKGLSDFSVNEELRMTYTDVGELVQKTLEFLEERFHSKQIKVIYEVGCGTFKVMADPERMKQVLLNIILNAINAMDEGGLLEVTIENTALDGVGDFIEVQVRDTGTGIAPEQLDKIFEPFHTIKRGGMGLGLSISKSIIDQHKGQIKVESVVGEGAKFIVRLPKQKKESVGITIGKEEEYD